MNHSFVRAALVSSFAVLLGLVPGLAPRPASAEPLIGKWGAFGTGPGQFHSPSQMAVDAQGNVYVADRDNDRIQKFSRTGVFITAWGSTGSSDGQFRSPSGIAVDPSGNVFVAEFLNHRIQKFTANGTFLLKWGSLGAGPGQFQSPYMIAANAAGEVYVVDYYNNRVERFSGTGTFLGTWGGLGTANGLFRFPSGIATDAAGNVFVGDILNDRIQKFTASGVFVTSWGSFGSGPGQFGNNTVLAGPYGVSTDGYGNVYVADGGNARIEKFDNNGTYLGQWGTAGSGDGQFAVDGAANVCATPDGYGIYVADLGLQRIQAFGGPFRLFGIRDVRNDQGRQVWLSFTRSVLDEPLSATPITQYEIYRRVDPLPLAPRASKAPNRGIIASAQLDGWAYLTSVPAHGDPTYTVVVPTLVDSMSDGIHWSVFSVRAATASPFVTTLSPPDSGYSVDNLPPAPPAPFTAAYAGGATHLHWGPNAEPDIWYYRVYRGASPDFVPGPGNLVVASPDTGYAHVGPGGGYYKLSAVDVTGNESAFAALGPNQTTGALEPTTRGFSLAGVHPNPVRAGRGSVTFTLVGGAPARLQILDVTGRQVLSLDLSALGAGAHTLPLGSDRRLPPGIYSARLTQGGLVNSRRFAVIE